MENKSIIDSKEIQTQKYLKKYIDHEETLKQRTERKQRRQAGAKSRKDAADKRIQIKYEHYERRKEDERYAKIQLELKNALREELKNELREELKNELREELKNELREELKNEINGNIKRC
jgi:hypothetical protein